MRQCRPTIPLISRPRRKSVTNTRLSALMPSKVDEMPSPGTAADVTNCCGPEFVVKKKNYPPRVVGTKGDLGPMSALGQKQTCAAQWATSAMGQKQTYAAQNCMSALPPKGNVQCREVRFGPKRTRPLYSITS